MRRSVGGGYWKGVQNRAKQVREHTAKLQRGERLTTEENREYCRAELWEPVAHRVRYNPLKGSTSKDKEAFLVELHKAVKVLHDRTKGVADTAEHTRLVFAYKAELWGQAVDLGW